MVSPPFGRLLRQGAADVQEIPGSPRWRRKTSGAHQGLVSALWFNEFGSDWERVIGAMALSDLPKIFTGPELLKYPCPKCSSDTNPIGSAPGTRRCVQCGTQFRPGVVGEKREELGCAPGCPAFVRQFAGARERCGNCGRWHTPAPTGFGPSRADYFAGSRPYGQGGYGRFG